MTLSKKIHLKEANLSIIVVGCVFLVLIPDNYMKSLLLSNLTSDDFTISQLQIAKITEEGVTISQPYALKTFWGFKAFENPTAGAEGSW